ncbi:hypothetical protein J5N97_023185 [Dioscorea zingiberensis]|uniref:ABC transporter domain-containing protein n=1 Tax=Dioscorea zingiberensis TaxID=325984 RepID=A0A9D5HBP7_9LILI|nr:hypothetical protein J5N97_023185 [Dioscorea zingiberensis]
MNSSDNSRMMKMAEIQPFGENYRSSSSSASSPARRATSSNFYYLRNPGCSKNPISFEDSPDWDEPDIFSQLEEGGDSIRMAATSVSPTLSNINAGSIPSPPMLEGAGSMPIAGATLTWRNVSVTVKGKRPYSDRVVKRADGYAMPASTTVILGPARSGKTTLLKALSGRLHDHERMLGEVFVNGSRAPMPYGTYGYVSRGDKLIESLTVREMLQFSALVQLPCFYSGKKSAVDDAIEAMSLSEVANKVIGSNCHLDGLSPGERRCVSIARELVMRPQVLFIDEPLYRLDSVSTILVMANLKKLAKSGCTIIITMCHSSTEVFGLYDRICLISNGSVLFFGQNVNCLQLFAEAGFPCPIMQSPSDHFLRAVSTDFDRVVAIIRSILDGNESEYVEFSSVNMDTTCAIRTIETTYLVSSHCALIESLIESLTEQGGADIRSKGMVCDATRIAVLTWRSLVVRSRDWKYYWNRVFLHMILAFSIGTIFFNVGQSLSSVAVRVAAIFAFVSFNLLISVVGLPAVIREIKIFRHEESNGHSGPLVFLLGHLLASVPLLFFISVTSSFVVYFLVGLQKEFSLFMYFILNIFMCLLANEGLMLLVSFICLEPKGAMGAMIFIHVLMMLVAGYLRVKHELPDPIWNHPLSDLAFNTYSIQGLLENEYIDAKFAVGQVREITGVQAVRGSYDISSSSNAKWGNLLILFLMAIGYRVLLLCLLHINWMKIIRAVKELWEKLMMMKSRRG